MKYILPILSTLFPPLSGAFSNATPAEIDNLFQNMLADPVRLVSWGAVAMVITIFIVSRGVERRLERASYFLMPTPFIILLAMVAYAMTTGHFIEGLKFMLVPDYSKLNVEGVLMALGQAFFSLSLGTIFSFNIWNFSIRYLATLGIFMIFLNAIGIFK